MRSSVLAFVLCIFMLHACAPQATAPPPASPPRSAVEKKEPVDAKACDLQLQGLKPLLALGDKRQLLTAVRRLATTYRQLRQAGAQGRALMECQKKVSGVLRELATTWHREAQKTQQPDLYELVQQAYQIYLASFPRAPDLYELTFYHAEVLFKLERWVQAARAYSKVVKLKEQGRYTKEAAYAAVISWKNALNVSTDQEHRRRTRSFEPIPIPARQIIMLQAFKTYLRLVPKAKERVPILYRSARIHYEHNHFAEAQKRFAEIVTRDPGHELAAYAANLLLDSLNIQKKFAEMERWVDRMLKDPLLAKGELLEQLKRLKHGMERKAAERLIKEHKYKECGERYVKLARAYPDNPRWAEVVYNAAICFEKAKLPDRAIAQHKALIQRKPRDPLAQRALLMIGEIHEAQGKTHEAAQHYEQFAGRFPGERAAPTYLERAVALRLRTGELGQARKDVELFAKNYAARWRYVARAAHLVFSLGEAYEQRHLHDLVVRHYKRYLKRWGRQGGLDLQVRAHVAIGRTLWQRSCPVKGRHKICVRIRRVRRGARLGVPTSCGPESAEKMIVVSRNAALVKKARARFTRALDLVKQAGPSPDIRVRDEQQKKERLAAMQLDAAWARFFQADALFEELLQVRFPAKLDFSSSDSKRARRSQKAFASYLAAKGKGLSRARTGYQQVIKVRLASAVIAAAGRIGQLYAHFADQLSTARVPRPPLPGHLKKRSSEERQRFLRLFTDTYCETLEDKTAPLRAKARQALESCLQRARELKVDDGWSRLCKEEAGRLGLTGRRPGG